MERITKTLKVRTPSDMAFRKFVDELNEWWPKEYTWSQGGLQEIRIDAKVNGLCTEIGPNGFRCDWGTVTALTERKSIALKWQIGPKREPVPDPDKASDLNVEFTSDGNSTTVTFEHFNFENHGEGFDDYRKMMGSEQGWDYILNKYKVYSERTS